MEYIIRGCRCRPHSGVANNAEKSNAAPSFNSNERDNVNFFIGFLQDLFQCLQCQHLWRILLNDNLISRSIRGCYFWDHTLSLSANGWIDCLATSLYLIFSTSKRPWGLKNLSCIVFGNLWSWTQSKKCHKTVYSTHYSPFNLPLIFPYLFC